MIVFALFIITGCSQKEPQLSSNSATILIKTPNMKFHDKGFIFKYKDFTQVQIFSAGTAILDMKIYSDKICKSTFRCQDLDSFNKENLGVGYKPSFLKDLFENPNKEIIHRDSKNGVLIKIIRD